MMADVVREGFQILEGMTLSEIDRRIDFLEESLAVYKMLRQVRVISERIDIPVDLMTPATPPRAVAAPVPAMRRGTILQRLIDHLGTLTKPAHVQDIALAIGGKPASVSQTLLQNKEHFFSPKRAFLVACQIQESQNHVENRPASAVADLTECLRTVQQQLILLRRPGPDHCFAPSSRAGGGSVSSARSCSSRGLSAGNTRSTLVQPRRLAPRSISLQTSKSTGTLRFRLSSRVIRPPVRKLAAIASKLETRLPAGLDDSRTLCEFKEHHMCGMDANSRAAKTDLQSPVSISLPGMDAYQWLHSNSLLSQ